MICRICPRCGGEWFSADTGPWVCAYCGARVDDRHNVVITERRKRKEGENATKSKNYLA